MNSVAVLRGGPSVEYDVSVQTGAGVLSSLRSSGYAVTDIVVTRKGQWLVNGFIKDPEKALLGVDVVFIALHGAYGEDGTVQRLLDRLAIPYTGSTSYASAIAMNKEITKGYLKDTAIKTPKYMRVSREGVKDPMQTAMSIGELFGPKYVLKPTSGGSSIGVRIVQNAHELGVVLGELLEEHDDLLIEEYISGREATVGILENYRDQQLYHLPSVEIIPPESSGYFDAEVKYNGETQEICPGRFKDTEKQEMAAIAQEVHQLLGLRHYSRSDFIVAEDGIYFLEVNTLPGLTSESLFPKSIDAVGGNYNELVKHLITQASTTTV